MDEVYGWETVLAHIICILGVGLFVMAAMTLFVVILVVCAILGLLLAVPFVQGFVQGWKEASTRLG